ncbi:MAG: hypothetical protein LQ343_007478 [Gyalolechia ehrenbergii]|nr:MAG: hypothetical protein LQ343_007478 [Gyalolechia ehrenbergii]
MAETRMAVASAVIVPEADEQPIQAPESGKRKTSSFTAEGSKRPKLDTESSPNRTETSGPTAASDRLANRRKSGQLEERKRGQRLFGALLGTLSQSSSSTAQKRRTDIERKQQAKLRVQAEEYDEQKKQRLVSLMAVRRKEQKKYDKQSMHIRHSNMLAQAHFLQTKTEPKLYYMPWELLPSEDAKIKSQIEAAEASIQHETEQLELENAKEAAKPQAEQKPPSSESNVDHEQEPGDAKETVGSEANIVQETNGLPNDASTDKKPEHSYPEPEQAPTNHQDNSKDHDDDGDEMVEADEDMVIY